GPWLATRRSAVDRRTATMLYASQDRSMSMRRWLPQNMRVRDGTTEWTVGDSAGEGRVCCGGAPGRRDGCGHSCADRFTVTEIFGHGLVVSGHLGPQESAQSRATAVAATDLTFLRAARVAKRFESRC